MRMFVRSSVLIALLALLCPSSARAGSITIQNVDTFTGVGTGYWFDGVESAAVLGSVTMSDGSGLGGSLDAPNVFEAYCVDILGPIDFPLVFTADAASMVDWKAPTGLNTELAGRRAAWLYNTYAATFTPSQLTERTALQMAIWEVLYDTTPDVIRLSPTSGRFAVSTPNADVAALATTYLADMLANSVAVSISDAAWIRISLKGDPIYQDFIGPGVPVEEHVPEPGTAMLLGLGMAGFAAFRSRKSMRRQA